MNYSEVKKEVKKEVDLFLKPKGFKSKAMADGCDFIKVDEFYTLNIGYGISNYGDVFDTSCYISVSFLPIDRIQQYVLCENGGYGICSGTKKYFNDINYSYKITTISDVIEWGKIISNFYEEYAIHFFNKYNTLNSIDTLLNETPTKNVVFLDDLGYRIIKGLIAAKLNNNPKYNELRDYYKSEVESKFQGYFMYPKCMKVIEFLDSHSYEEIITISETV